MIGTSGAYIWRMIATEFVTPVPSWRILPLPKVMRDPKGWLVREGVPDTELRLFEGDETIERPVRIQEHKTFGQSSRL
jgi:hypothetical protein